MRAIIGMTTWDRNAHCHPWHPQRDGRLGVATFYFKITHRDPKHWRIPYRRTSKTATMFERLIGAGTTRHVYHPRWQQWTD